MELDQLPPKERAQFRNSNSAAIASLPPGRALIVSGPGTGKSNLFLQRIERWLATASGGVLVTSFVRKLVRDLTRDVEQDSTLTPEKKKLVRVSTLHKLARSLVEQSHGTRAWPFRPHFKVVAWPWREVVWEDIRAFGVLDPDGEPPCAKNFEAYLHQDEPEPASWAAVREAYFKLCQFYNAAGFADLIIRARDAIRERPELVTERYFIVDEYQDFNLSEQALIDTLCADASGVLLAGDDDQVLYEHLKCGDPALIRGLYEADRIVNAMLPYCSRCGHHITKTAAGFIREHPDEGRISKVFLPITGPDDGSAVTAVACATPSTVVAFVRSWLKAHHQQLLARQTDLAEGRKKEAFVLFLAPSLGLKFLGKERDAFLAEVAAYRGDVPSQLSEDYYNVAVFYALGRRPTDNFELRKGLHLCGVTVDVVHKLIVQAIDQRCTLGELGNDDVARVLRLGTAVAEACTEEPDAHKLATRIAAMGDVRDIARLTADLLARPLSDAAILELRQQEEATGEQQDAGEPTARAVDVLTIVGSKGLSADHVILLGCDAVSMKHVSPKAFFVGLTRARISLTLVANVKAIGAQTAHEYVLGLHEGHVVFAKYTQKGQLEEFDSAAEFSDYFERLAYATRAGRT